MASRYSAARPKRASEAFARAHHGEERDEAFPTPKKVKFDVRNPSALAPSARDEDEDNDGTLEADVIGASGRATKRGAVNIDGYDSDSDNETFNARAEARGRNGKTAEDVDLAEVMDNYTSKDGSGGKGDADDDEVDMFGDFDDGEATAAGGDKTSSRKDKQVRFLTDKEIQGQENASKSGGTVRIDGYPGNNRQEEDEREEEEEDDDDETVALAIAEEGVDAEVGLGGLKKHAPKIDAFNMREEQEEGAFDEAGNYIRKAADEDAAHDRWLEGISKKEMKRAAEAHDKREAELRKQQRENDSLLTGDLFKELIVMLEPVETALDALGRLRRGQTKQSKTKKMPKWKQKKARVTNGGEDCATEAMDVDTDKAPEDPEQVRIREAINTIADAADKLMQRDYPNIYDWERERLIREYRNETGETWVEPPPPESDEAGEKGGSKMWEFRWIDGRDGAPKQGPFDGPTMKAWQDAGYFGEGVEFRLAGEEGEWLRVATFG